MIRRWIAAALAVLALTAAPVAEAQRFRPGRAPGLQRGFQVFAPPGPITIFSDDFNRNGILAGSTGWGGSGTNLQTDGSQIAATGSTTQAVPIAAPLASAHFAQVTLVQHGGSLAGAFSTPLLADWLDASNYGYVFNEYGAGVKYYEVVAGTPTLRGTLTAIDFEEGLGQVIRVEVSGSNVALRVNGTLRGTLNTRTLTTATKAGLFANADSEGMILDNSSFGNL